MFSGVGKTARRARRRGRRGHPLHQRRIRARARAAVGRSPPPRAAPRCISLRVNPDVDAKTHAKISTGKSENKFGMPISRARDVYAHAGQAAGHRASPASTCISAARSPTCSRSTTPSRCCPISCARCAPTGIASSMSISAAGSAFPIATTTSRRPIPHAYADGGQARHARSRLHADLRAGPDDRRQCRHPGRRGCIYREARRGQDLRHRRCGDERPDPPDALRGASRHPAGRGAGAGRARASSPTWSARSARPATIWRSTATCRSRSRRPDGGHDGRRLRGGAGRHLQYPRAGAGSAGERRRMGAGAAARRGRRADRARPAARRGSDAGAACAAVPPVSATPRS